MQTDLGIVRLPEPQTTDEGLDVLDGYWITAAGLERVLAGDTPAPTHFVPERKLWRRETRVGIGINGVGTDADGNAVSRLAERRPVDGALYSASHIRLEPDVELRVSVITKGNSRLETRSGSRLSPAGGEHRMVEIADQTHGTPQPKAPDTFLLVNGKLRLVVYCASPCLLSEYPEPGQPLAHLPGGVVSACLGKAVMIGGWNSQSRSRGPIPMRPAVPAGSIWFLEADEKYGREILDRHGTHIGEATEWGFGQIFIGTW